MILILIMIQCPSINLTIHPSISIIKFIVFSKKEKEIFFLISNYPPDKERKNEKIYKNQGHS